MLEDPTTPVAPPEEMGDEDWVAERAGRECVCGGSARGTLPVCESTNIKIGAARLFSCRFLLAGNGQST